MAEHTGAWITAGYVVLSLLGLLHQAMVLRRFGVNYVEYAQLADFLLAAIRDPFVVLASVIPGALVYGFYVWFGQWTSHRNPGQVPRGAPQEPAHDRPALPGGVAAANRRRVGDLVPDRLCQRRVGAYPAWRGGARGDLPVQCRHPPRPFPTDSALIITVTSGYVFAYFPTNYETRVIPSDNLAYLGRRRVPQRRIPTLVPGWRAPAATPTDSTP
ncbi:MAG: hypothetical protein IPJ56_15880 [Gemmatimonadetes bacterium]|nr:hypothetical protein [Gemmatimonadota bacterium]